MADDAERVLDDHGAFERDDDAFQVTTTPFKATVTVRDATFRVTVRAPSIDAAVEGDDVAPVVQEGWLETFERRMEDADQPLSAGQAVDPTVAVEDGEVVVEGTVEAGAPGIAADDARALVEYVEGTYMEGVIPGYEYVDPVASMRQRAFEQG